MDSVRSFVRLWAGLTVIILAYAFLDLRMHPWLLDESNFTMRPDLTRVGDLAHWGGRLLRENALSLLVGNALVLGGLLALCGRWVTRRIRAPAAAVETAVVERISVFPTEPPLSTRPPR
jgi:hypothetical protein